MLIRKLAAAAYRALGGFGSLRMDRPAVLFLLMLPVALVALVGVDVATADAAPQCDTVPYDYDSVGCLLDSGIADEVGTIVGQVLHASDASFAIGYVYDPLAALVAQVRHRVSSPARWMVRPGSAVP